MNFLYILENKNTGKYYIGSTNNLRRRLDEHLKGKVRTTRVLKTNSLVYFEKFETESESRQREKKLKSYKSKKYIKWLISNKTRASSSIGRADAS